MDKIKFDALKNVKWVSFARILPKVFAPITTILFMNVFNPTDYGVVGICSAFINLFTLIQGFGIDDYLMKEGDLTDAKVSTAFWINFGLSFVLYIILCIITPLIAFVYKSNNLNYFLPLIGVNLILNACGFIPRAILRKYMKFKILFLINFAPLIISLIITLPLGYYAKLGVWALIIGNICLTLFTNIYFYLSSKVKPKLIFDKNISYAIKKFGKYVIWERLQEYLYANIDIFFIAFFMDLKTVGLYSVAKSWSWLIFEMLTSPITEILYPSFQNFIGNIKKMSSYYLQVEKRIFFVLIPLLILVIFYAENIIVLILPERWHRVYGIFIFLFLGDSIAKSFSFQRDLFKLNGRPDIYPKAFMFNFFYSMIFFPFGAYFGLKFFLVIRVLNDLLYTIIQFVITKKFFLFKTMEFIKIIKAEIISGLIILFLNLFFSYLVINNLLDIIVSIILVLTFYLLGIFMLDKEALLKYFNELKVIIGLHHKYA